MQFRVGDRAATRRDIDYRPYTTARQGETGTVAQVIDDVIYLRLDQVHPGLSYFDNEIALDGSCEDLAALLCLPAGSNSQPVREWKLPEPSPLSLWWTFVPLGLASVMVYALSSLLPDGRPTSVPYMLAIVAAAGLLGPRQGMLAALATPLLHQTFGVGWGHVPASAFEYINAASQIAVGFALPWCRANYKNVYSMLSDVEVYLTRRRVRLKQ